MKGTLKKIRSKAVVAFLCALVVFANVIPVSAAELSSTSSHGCVSVQYGKKEFQCYEKSDNSMHVAKYFVRTRCQTCGKEMGYETVYGDAESHSFGYYLDRGHVSENDHVYEVICQCNYGETIRLITCQWKETGRHVTPW